MKKILNNKRGEGSYLFLCVLVIVISLLSSVLILYMGLVAKVQVQKRDMKAKLDDYVAEHAIEVYTALKHGDRYDEFVDYAAFRDDCLGALGFERNGIYQYRDDACTLSAPTITVIKDDGFGITMKYTASFPVEWDGKAYSDVTVPITITSYYKLK